MEFNFSELPFYPRENSGSCYGDEIGWYIEESPASCMEFLPPSPPASPNGSLQRKPIQRIIQESLRGVWLYWILIVLSVFNKAQDRERLMENHPRRGFISLVCQGDFKENVIV